MVRTLAGWQVDRYPAIFRWPLAEALAAYEAHLREDAERGYIVEYIGWNIRVAAGSKEKPPKLPAILQE